MIITIGRQYGSGGREVGEKLAQKLGYKFYDQELVEMAAEKSNMHSSILHQADEKASKSLLYSIVTGMDSRFLSPYYELPINDKLFIEQSNIIKSLGEEGNCVIVGRCADYVIETAKMKSIDLFIYASMEHKIERISKTALCILRLAIFEILYMDDIPASVSINEAVEIAKKYASVEDASFINGILSTVLKKL